MTFSITRRSPGQSTGRIPSRQGRWRPAQALPTVHRPSPLAGAGTDPFGNTRSLLPRRRTPGWRPFAPAGYVVHAFIASMASSDARLPLFPCSCRGQAIDAAGFLSYGPNTRSSPKGTWSWRFDSRVSPSAGHQLRGCLAITPTGLSPVSPPQLSGHTLWRLARVGLTPTG
jgi:hypothetical protein